MEMNKIIISKHSGYEGKILLNLDTVREIKFNAGEKIEVSQEELNQIGNHRWLIVEEYNGNKNQLEDN